MKSVGIARGMLMVCDPCYAHLQEERLIDGMGRISVTDTAISTFDHLCPNCYDNNKPLIDDMIGSSE